MKNTENNNSLGREAKFNTDELFFSITSHDSTILSGNEVFTRISGYSKEEIIGHYHNIVRHKNMPRIIFKILWEYLQTDRPIVGYIKNRAKNGDYYWVLAAVFPMAERYVSIRIKPTTRLFSAIGELYPILLSAEERGGMAESAKLVPTLLKKLGYEDYPEFMSDALLHELRERQKLLSSGLCEEYGSDVPFVQQLQAAQGYARTLTGAYDAWFDKIDIFIRTRSMFEETSLVLRQVAREIVFLSLNASVASYKVERGGEAFGILALDIRTNAKENDELIGKIDVLVHSLSSSLNDLIFSVSGIRLQTEMISYFIDELLRDMGGVEQHEMESNMDTLVRLITGYSEKTDALQIVIERQLQEVLGHLDQLEKQMMYLGYIQVYGIIEAAGNQHETVSFEEIFSQLKALIVKTSLELEGMQKMGGIFYAENRRLREQSAGIGAVLYALREEIASIKELEG